jgi:tetratricopeptide (TPR) repeat protein
MLGSLCSAASIRALDAPRSRKPFAQEKAEMKFVTYILLFSISLLLVSCDGGTPSTSQTNAQPQAAKTSLEYMREGSAFYQRGNYQKAIEPYQKALDLEKAQPKIDKNMWRALVDNLAMSYGISGNLQKAKETLEYGLSKDPDYPMFYYIMANTYAEMNDEDNAIAYLKRAFERKGNMIAGETFPDPAKDDSFQRFMKSEKFLKALEEMKLK